MAQVSGCIDPLLYCFLSAEFRKDLQKIITCRFAEATVFASEIDGTGNQRCGFEIWNNARKVAENIGKFVTYMYVYKSHPTSH